MDHWTFNPKRRRIHRAASAQPDRSGGGRATVSRFAPFPQFGQAQLSSALEKSGIEYFHFPDLGGRRKPQPDSPNTAWRNEAFRGYADYMTTEPFRAALGQLLQIARSKRTAMLCAEAVWWQCHRGLIADQLKAGWHTVWHIMGQGRVEPHPFTSAARIVEGRLSYAVAGQELKLPL
ncbi:MAG TPA: DUF488 domain-containing protein [Verrucomicrobiae bacterium]|nr:DUF488 domain-containing protein [Verrucomicrobiae bacterium]